MIKGFTLIEILMVVLIIGILGAIALPQYQRAVLKSRFAALMPIAKSMADSNEVYYLENGEYAEDAEDLPVQGRKNYSDGTKLEFGTLTGYSYVLATRNNDFPNNYIVYQKHSENFPGNIHCEALEGNTQANEVCISLGGTPINGSLTDGYKTYVLSGTYGATDKLPTSINKLKAQICGTQFTGSNCIVDEVNNTITTQECEGSFPGLHGAGFSNCIKRTYDDTTTQTDYVRENKSCDYINSAATPKTSCVIHKYNESGTQLPGYTRTNCYFALRGGKMQSNGECIATRINDSYYYDVLEYDSNDNKIKATRYMCTELTDGKCSSIETRVTTY